MQTDPGPRRAMARLDGSEMRLMLITGRGFNTDCAIKNDATNEAGVCIHVSFNHVSFLALVFSWLASVFFSTAEEHFLT